MRLRPFRPADLDALAPWLARAASDAGCASWADAGALGLADEHVLAGIEDGASAILAFAPDEPSAGCAQVRFLAVDPERRRLGIGGRAALALERRLRRSARAIYVRVPERLGLALYFWLRLGYRPLTQREWPAPAGDEGTAATWMVRKL